MKLRISAILLSCSFLVLNSNADALKIEYTTSNATPTEAAAFGKAVQNWEKKLKDPVTVYIDVAFTPMAADEIGGTWPSLWYAGFGGVLGQLNLDQTSANDVKAVNYLNSLPQNDPFFSWYSNDVLYNSDAVIATSANLKALGYEGFSSADATMKFNSDFKFDYDPSDGIEKKSIDFVGVATHEIGHALGFMSIVDYNAYFNRETDPYPPSILDLYRHTDKYGFDSIDISFDGRDAYFSHDLGQTKIDFSDGINSPDGRQASHWADNLGLGIMDPTASYGESLKMTNNDLVATDVIGWDVVPEPTTLFLVCSGFAALPFVRKRQK